jgi:hypothetical protein
MKHLPMGRRRGGAGGPITPRGPGPRDVRPRDPGSRDVRPRDAGSRDRDAGDPGGGGARTPAIDLFIDRGLHELFDKVMDEPVPEELLRLIEDDRKK